MKIYKCNKMKNKGVYLLDNKLIWTQIKNLLHKKITKTKIKEVILFKYKNAWAK
jgi:hypothetical protein